MPEAATPVAIGEAPSRKIITISGTDGTTFSVKRDNAPVQATSDRCPVYHLDINVEANAYRGSRSKFDELVNSLENDADSAAGMNEARRWVSNEFYSSNIPTLASLRLRAGMSQRELGKACGIEQPHVSRYESGKHEPSIGIAIQMASALGVGIQEFSIAWENTRAEPRPKVTR